MYNIRSLYQNIQKPFAQCYVFLSIGFMHSCTTSWSSASSLFPSCLPLLAELD